MGVSSEPSTNGFLFDLGKECSYLNIPRGLKGGLWGFLLLCKFLDLGASYFFVAVSFRMMTWVLLDTTYWIVFPLQGALWRLSPRRCNIFSIACKFCCQMVLYMLFTSSQRLAIQGFLTIIGNQVRLYVRGHLDRSRYLRSLDQAWIQWNLRSWIYDA